MNSTKGCYRPRLYGLVMFVLVLHCSRGLTARAYASESINDYAHKAVLPFEDVTFLWESPVTGNRIHSAIYFQAQNNQYSLVLLEGPELRMTRSVALPYVAPSGTSPAKPTQTLGDWDPIHHATAELLVAVPEGDLSVRFQIYDANLQLLKDFSTSVPSGIKLTNETKITDGHSFRPLGAHPNDLFTRYGNELWVKVNETSATLFTIDLQGHPHNYLNGRYWLGKPTDPAFASIPSYKTAIAVDWTTLWLYLREDTPSAPHQYYIGRRYTCSLSIANSQITCNHSNGTSGSIQHVETIQNSPNAPYIIFENSLDSPHRQVKKVRISQTNTTSWSLPGGVVAPNWTATLALTNHQGWFQNIIGAEFDFQPGVGKLENPYRVYSLNDPTKKTMIAISGSRRNGPNERIYAHRLMSLPADNVTTQATAILSHPIATASPLTLTPALTEDRGARGLFRYAYTAILGTNRFYVEEANGADFGELLAPRQETVAFAHLLNQNGAAVADYSSLPSLGVVLNLLTDEYEISFPDANQDPDCPFMEVYISIQGPTSYPLPYANGQALHGAFLSIGHAGIDLLPHSGNVVTENRRFEYVGKLLSANAIVTFPRGNPNISGEPSFRPDIKAMVIGQCSEDALGASATGLSQPSAYFVAY